MGKPLGKPLQYVQSCVKKNPAKFPESPSKCSAAHPKIALLRNISASHFETWQECFYTTLYKVNLQIQDVTPKVRLTLFHPLAHGAKLLHFRCKIPRSPPRPGRGRFPLMKIIYYATRWNGYAQSCRGTFMSKRCLRLAS